MRLNEIAQQSINCSRHGSISETSFIFDGVRFIVDSTFYNSVSEYYGQFGETQPIDAIEQSVMESHFRAVDQYGKAIKASVPTFSLFSLISKIIADDVDYYKPAYWFTSVNVGGNTNQLGRKRFAIYSRLATRLGTVVDPNLVFGSGNHDNLLVVKI